MADDQRIPMDEEAQSKSRKKKRSKSKRKARAERRSFGFIPQVAARVLALGGVLAVALVLGRLMIVRR